MVKLYCHLLGLGVLSIPISRVPSPKPQSQSQLLDNSCGRCTVDSTTRILALDAGVLQPLLEHIAWLLVHVLPDLLGNLVGIVTGGGHPHCAGLVVHMVQLVA